MKLLNAIFYHKLRYLIMILFWGPFIQLSYSQTLSDGCSTAAAQQLTIGTTCSAVSYSLPGSFAGPATFSSCVPNSGANQDDGWFWFSGNGGYVNVTSTGTGQNHVLAIHSGTCASMTYIKCDGEVAAGVSARVTVLTTSGTTYFVQIHRTSGNGTASMTGTVCVTSTALPGGISNGLGSWYSSDGLLITSGTTVKKWYNNTGGPDLINSNGTPLLSSTLANFNPAVQFDNNDYVNGPANGTTFTGVNNNTTIMANRIASGAVVAKWEETGQFLNRISMEGLGTSIRYDHPDRNSYPVSTTNVINNWILSTGLGSSTINYLYVNGVNEGSTTPVAPATTYINTPSAVGSIMFGSNTNGSFGANTDLAEIIYYTVTLSAPEQNKVESYMATKYGITLGSTTNLVNYHQVPV